MWLIVLSDQLPIDALVSSYPTNQLIGRGPILWRSSEKELCFPREAYAGLSAISRRYPSPQGRFPRVTHPSATPFLRRAYDLHVLGTPPAFILSQDQTRHSMLYLHAQPNSHA